MGSIEGKIGKLKGYAFAASLRSTRTHSSRLKAALKDDTDFQIVVGDYHWDVHEDILVSHSTFFKTIIRGPWGVCQQAFTNFT